MRGLNRSNFLTEVGARFPIGLDSYFRYLGWRRLRCSAVKPGPVFRAVRLLKCIGHNLTPTRCAPERRPSLSEFGRLWGNLEQHRANSANSEATSADFWRARPILVRIRPISRDTGYVWSDFGQLWRASAQCWRLRHVGLCLGPDKICISGKM